MRPGSGYPHSWECGYRRIRLSRSSKNLSPRCPDELKTAMELVENETRILIQGGSHEAVHSGIGPILEKRRWADIGRVCRDAGAHCGGLPGVDHQLRYEGQRQLQQRRGQACRLVISGVCRELHDHHFRGLLADKLKERLLDTWDWWVHSWPAWNRIIRRGRREFRPT